MARTVGLLGAGVAALFVVWLAAVSSACAAGSCAATAQVEGRTYVQGGGRDMLIEPQHLTPYATVTRRSPGRETLDEQAYRLGDADPTKVLVMRLSPGQTDDAGPLGDYLLLVSEPGGWAQTCPYFRADDPSRPDVCP